MKKNLRIKAIEWCQHSAGNLPLLHLNSLVNQKSFCGCPAKCIFWLFWADSWSGYCLEVPLWVCCWHWSATCWVAITVTLAIICIEEDHEPLSLLDLKRLGRPSPFGRWGGGGLLSKGKWKFLIPARRSGKDICAIWCRTFHEVKSSLHF